MADSPTTRTAAGVVPTLHRDDYTSEAVFRAELERIFHSGWMFVAHTSSLPPGSRRVVELGGESVVVTRDREGHLHALANVCRHRGARLCAPTDPTADGADCAAPSIQCPYHAWTYALDGTLLAMPRVDRDEIDRGEHPLWTYRADEWNGLVFVSLASDGQSLDEWLARWSPDLLAFGALSLGELRVLERTVADVAANWKIVVENYHECLHCAVVHPELVEIVPVYRTGNVLDPDRDDGAVELADGGNSFSASGSEDLPRVPGLRDGEEHLYQGAAVFPNLFVDVTGTAVSLTALLPVAADRTIVVAEYLFAPDVRPGPSDDHRDAVAAVVAFNELVGAQDYAVCESVQQGVGSRAFTRGVLTLKDALVARFDEQYRSAMGTTDPT